MASSSILRYRDAFPSRRICSISLAAFALVATAPAQTVFLKANNADDLILGSSWVTGTVPDASSIAQWDSTVTGPNAVNVGGTLAFLGLKLTNPGGPVTINAGGAITLGTGGIDMSAATQDLTINADVTIANGKQVWNVATGRTLTLLAAPTKPGQPAPNNAGVVQFGTTGTINLGAATTNLILDNQNNPWATYGLSDWAGLNAGTVVASTYTPATTAVTAGVINDIQGDITINATVDVSALRFADPTARTLQISTSATASRTLTARGILVTPESGGGTIGGTTAGNTSFIRPSRVTVANTAFNVIQNSAADFTIAANIANASSGAAVQLVKSGPGKLILNDAFGQGYTGGTTINEGTLQIGNGGTFGSLGGGDVTNNGSLVFNRSSALTVINNIGGTGPVTQAGSGELAFTTNVSTYTGPTNLDAGTLSFTTLQNLGNGSIINFNGGALKWAPGNTEDVSSRTLRFNSGAAILDTNGNNVTLANPVGDGGTGTLTKAGAGTLTLGAANTFSGGAVVNAGTLTLANTAGSATGSGAVTVNSGGVLAGTGTAAGIVSLNSGGMLAPGGSSVGIVTLGGLTLSIGSILDFQFTSPAAFDKAVVINNNGLTITGGGFNAAGWTTPGSYNLISFTGAIQGAGPSTLSATNEPAGYDYIFGASGSFLTVNVVTEGVIRNWTAAGGGSWANAANWNGTVPNEIGATANFGNSITAPSTVTLDGDKTLGAITFNSAQSYTISAGTGGSLTLQKTSGTGQSVIVSGNHTIAVPVVLGSDLTAEVAAGGRLTVSGPISGSRMLIKIGGGALVLTGTSTYTGRTQVDEGTLTFTDVANLGGGTEVGLNGGTLQWAAGSTADLSIRVLTIGANGATLDTNGNNVTFAGPIGNTSAGGLKKAGAGTLTLAPGSTYAGSTTVAGGSLAISSNDSLGGAGTGAGLILDGGTLAATTSLSLDEFGVNARPVTIGAAGGGIDVADTAVLTIPGVVSGTGTLTKAGSGTLTLTGLNTYSGGTTLQAGILIANNGAALGTGPLTLGSGTTFNSGAVFFGNPITAPAGSVTMGSTAALGSNGYSGVISGGDQNSRIIVTGQTSFNGGGNIRQFADTFTGTVEVSAAATLRFSATSGLNNGGNNTTFDVLGTLTARNTGTVNVGALTGTGFVSGASGANTNTSTFIVGAKGIDTTFAGSIIDADLANGRLAAVTKVGAGTLTLSGTNTYTGPTTISAGTLLVNGALMGTTTSVNGGTLGGAGVVGPVVVNSGATLAPGVTIESLELMGDLTLNPNAIFALDIDTTAAATDLAVITGNLLLDATGSVALAVTDRAPSTGIAQGTVLTFIDYADSGWNGNTFAGLPDDSTLSVGANQFRISYNGADNATSAVVLQVVPEPSAAISLLGASLLLGLKRIRRQTAREVSG